MYKRQGFEYQYGADNTIEIFMNEKWIVFEQREGAGNQVRYGDRMVDAVSYTHLDVYKRQW